MRLRALRAALDSKTLSVSDVLERYTASQSQHAHLNAFITPLSELVNEPYAPAVATGSPLCGAPISLKDNFCTANIRTSCASRMLSDPPFLPPSDATIWDNLRSHGAVLGGKTNMDEFGMGSMGVHSYYGPVLNPVHGDCVAGGSSSGAAASVAADLCLAAIGSDTGGSVRLPAAYCDIVGFKPTYGLLSRNGLLAYASSLDTPGVLAHTVQDCADVLYGMAKPWNAEQALEKELDRDSMQKWTNDGGELEWDQELTLDDIYTRTQEKRNDWKVVIGIPTEINQVGLSREMQEKWSSVLDTLARLDHCRLVPVSIPNMKISLAAYYVIASAEAASNLSRYDGNRYGLDGNSCRENQANRGKAGARTNTSGNGNGNGKENTHTNMNPLDHLDFEAQVISSRTHGFGETVQRRIYLGNYVLQSESIESHYMQALKVRRVLHQDFVTAFKGRYQQPGCDIILLPTSPYPPPKRDLPMTVQQESSLDAFTVPASLAGLPVCQLPLGDGMGVQVMGDRWEDAKVLMVAQQLSKWIE